MRLLLVDDDRTILTSLTRGLRVERPDWDVVTASDGVKALRLLRSSKVDILVSDVLMPTMGGMALLEAVRTDPNLAALPLILISGSDDRPSIRSGMASGADDYLTKPFSLGELIQSVEGRLRRLKAGEDPAAASLQAEVRKLLTGREWEVLAQIGSGLATTAIAEKLKLSISTTNVHRHNLMKKLDLHNAAALAALAIRANIA